MTTSNTFNRSNIAKSAWKLVKAHGLTLSQAMKRAWKKEKEAILLKIKTAIHEEILPFKRDLHSNGVNFDGFIQILDNNNIYHKGITSWSLVENPELVNFTGYLITVSGNWFDVFNSEEFKKDIDSICYRIDGKKVTCNFDKMYRWAIQNVEIEKIVAIARKYKLFIF